MANAKQKPKKKTEIPKASAVSNPVKGGLLTSAEKESLGKYKEINVIFSFQFFDRSDELFNCGKTDSAWFLSLVDTLKSVSQMKFEDFRKEKRTLRVHPHDWEKVSKEYPFNDVFLTQIKDDALQFSVSKATGRVHGFAIENVFYVVWFDPHHNLYPMERHGGLTYCDNPKDCYDCLSIENEKLKQEIKELNELLQIASDENEQLKTQSSIAL